MSDYPALEHAVTWCADNGVEIPSPMLRVLSHIGVKTEDYYARVLIRGVRDVYYGRATEDDLLTTMARLLDEQMRRAWNEGMRANDLDPQQDMTEEWEAQLQAIIDDEFSHVEQFIADVAQARDDKSSITPLLSRAEMWASRYVDVVNQAIIATAGAKDRLVWRLGATEEHCDICASLNGIVAYATEWQELNVRPQNPPNPALSKENGGCGGWRCDCSLEPTEQRRSPDAYTTIMNIVTV
jgi:hypothetical protein